jgi:hypothetical protein
MRLPEVLVNQASTRLPKNQAAGDAHAVSPDIEKRPR